MLAVVGLVAGFVLLILAKLQVTGIIVVAVGILAAVAVGVSKAIEPLEALQERQHDQEDKLHSIVVGGEPLTLADADPFQIGVFRSQIAEESARKQGSPEYVRRTIDDMLWAAFDEEALVRSKRLVVLRGDPKAGKSRTLWEAVRRLDGRRVVALKAPDPGVERSDPAAEPLRTLLALERPLSNRQGSDLVIWIDDAHNHLDHGLTRNNLRRLVESHHYPQAIIAATIHAGRLHKIKDFDRELHALLREPFDGLQLEPQLDSAELKDAKERYPGVAENVDLKYLPELFAAVRALIDRYQQSRAEDPEGVAVAAATIVWQRAGMPPGSVNRPTLQALTKLTLQDIAPARELTDETFADGLLWSKDPVAKFAALVGTNGTDAGGKERYKAFDAVVSWAQRNEPPLARTVWDFVLDHADARSLNAVAMEASYAQQLDVAERAWVTAIGSIDPDVSAVSSFRLGVLLKNRGRSDEAEATYRAAIDSGHPAIAPMATVNLAVVLKEAGRLDEAEATYQAAIDSGHPDIAPVAWWALGELLQQRDRLDEAEAAYQAAIDSGHFQVAHIVRQLLGALREKRK